MSTPESKPERLRKVPSVWTEPRTLRCRPYNPPLQWRVESESMPEEPHLVDLGGFDGNGECSCMDFQTRRAPELKAGRRPGPATRCKHIKAAREALLNRVVRKVTQEQEGARPSTLSPASHTASARANPEPANARGGGPSQR